MPEMKQTRGAGLPTPQRYWAALAIWLTMALAVFDSTIPNVALPTIARGLGVSADGSLWIVYAYQLAIVMFLFPASALAETYGYNRIYLLGIVVFVLTSIGCALAKDLETIAIARLLQGVGAAMLMALNPAMIRLIYPESQLGRGIGYNAMVIALCSAAGPSAAAAVLAIAPWPWLFALNVPIGLIAIGVGLRTLPVGIPTGERVSIQSSVLNAVMFAAIFLAAVDLSHIRLSWPLALEVVIALGTGTILVTRSRRERAPMFPIDLISVPILRLSYLTSICSFGAMMAALIALPFLLEGQYGVPAVHIGLLLTAWPMAICIAAPIAGYLVERFSAGILGAVGLSILAMGLGAIALAPSWAGIVWLEVALTASGIGFGLFQTPNNRVMMGHVPRQRSGAASGMLAVSRVFGQTVGAVLTGMAFFFMGPLSRAPFFIAAGLAAIAAATSFGRTFLTKSDSSADPPAAAAFAD